MKKISAAYSVLKALLPCLLFGRAIAAGKDNPVGVVTANSGRRVRGAEAQNLLCRDSGIVRRGMTKHPDFINLKCDIGLLN